MLCFENKTFSIVLKNFLAYDNAGVVVKNQKAVGLAPGDKVKCVLKVCYLSEIKIRLLAYM
jgi:hypothetical protein